MTVSRLSSWAPGTHCGERGPKAGGPAGAAGEGGASAPTGLAALNLALPRSVRCGSGPGGTTAQRTAAELPLAAGED